MTVVCVPQLLNHVFNFAVLRLLSQTPINGQIRDQLEPAEIGFFKTQEARVKRVSDTENKSGKPKQEGCESLGHIYY